MSAMLISVPLTLNYLGNERYGMWMAMTSLIALFAFADLGIGNGLMNNIATAYGKDDHPRIRESIASGYFILTIISGVIITAFLTLYPHIPWPKLFNVKSASGMREAGPAFLSLVLCFAVGIPLNVVQKVQNGLQRGFMANLWQCFSSLFGLSAILVATHFHAGLAELVFALVGAPLVANVLNTVVYFGIVNPTIRPKISEIRLGLIRDISSKGGLFFILQLVASLSYSADAFIIAQVLGPSAVSQYSVPDKMFSVISSIIIMLLQPLWPAYGEAKARNDTAFIKLTLKRSIFLAVGASSVISATLILASPWLLKHWLGRTLSTPFILIIGLGVWRIIEALCNSLAVFLNGTGVIRTQIIISLLTCAGNLTLKFMLLRTFGIAGGIWATILATIALTLFPYYFIIRRYLDK